ncbi:MAG: CBS domain-containing protein [Thermoplasmata archaeon]
MTLRDLELKGDYKTISPDASAAEAIALMAEYRVPLLLVEKTGPGDTEGVITRRDIIGKLIAEGLDPERVTARELASKPLLILNNVEVAIEWVAAAMAQWDVSCLAIFDRGEFRGFVTDRDVLRGWLRRLEGGGKAQAGAEIGAGVGGEGAGGGAGGRREGREAVPGAGGRDAGARDAREGGAQ